MKAMRVAVSSLGYIWALSVYAAQPGTEIEQPDQLEEATAQYARLEASPLDAYWQNYWSVRERSEMPGLGWQVDADLFDGLHKVVGFWPSVHWLNSSNIGTSMASLGYTWRNLKLEGALFKGRESDQNRNPELLRIDSTTRRLSYTFGPNWAFRLSRGLHNSPDQLRYGQKVKRSAASVTYQRALDGNPWNTTLAFARGRDVGGTYGNAYMLESAMRVDNHHTFFGRLERAGNDQLFREEDGPRDRRYQVNKLTIGYLYDVKNFGPARLGIGAIASRRVIPDELIPYYGNKNNSYMIFMKLHMQFAVR